jgi:hypothetical protein
MSRRELASRTLLFYDVLPPPAKLLTVAKVDGISWTRIPGTPRYRAVHTCGWPLSSGEGPQRPTAVRCARCKAWVRIP